MSLRLIRSLAFAVIGFTLPLAVADQMSAYPSVSVADGRSTTTITAQIRDRSGRAVPDGTRVVFNTTLGTFRETITTTTNGLARAILVAGGAAGVARITASPLSGGGSPSTFEFEFVADRTMLSSAREYIEIVAPGVMHYTVDTRLIGAAGPGHGVTVRYRDIEVEADDVQIDVARTVLRARKAHLKFGKLNQDFDELYLQLNQRKGFGTTSYKAPLRQILRMQGRWLGLAVERPDGVFAFDPPPMQDRYGLVEIKGPAFIPATSNAGNSNFEFEELVGSPSSISAKKAVIFPNKQIQFQKAEIYIADRKVMSMPLFQVNMQQSSGSPVITEQLVNVNNNQLAINYPYFLSLKPGQTSLLRFRTGDQYGRGTSSSSGGAFVDYELNWNRGDDMDGGIALRGIGRNDWRVGVQQYMRLDDRSTITGQVEIPSGRSFFGSAGYNRQFDGFQMSLNGSQVQSLRGPKVTTSDYSAIIEGNPIKMGRAPFTGTIGLTAQTTSNSVIGSRQTSEGIRARLQSFSIPVNAATSFTTSMSASAVKGENVGDGLLFSSTTSLSHQVGKAGSMLLSYDFTRDGYNDKYLGQHRLSAQTYWNFGRLNLNLFGTKSLDVDRADLYGDMSFRLSGLWRLSASYTYDKYLSNQFLDYDFSVGYRLGWREVGLIWSKRTNRIGIQLLGATID